jgi:hypothetical protein
MQRTTTPIQEIQQYFEEQRNQPRFIDHDAISAVTSSTQFPVLASPRNISPTIDQPVKSVPPVEKKKVFQPNPELGPLMHFPARVDNTQTQNDVPPNWRYLHDEAYKLLCELRTCCTNEEQFQKKSTAQLKKIYGASWKKLFSLPLAIVQMEKEGHKLSSAPAQKIITEPVIEFTKDNTSYNKRI